MAQPPIAMRLAVPKLLANPVNSDFNLVYDDHEWQLHRIVLCTQSSYFAKLFEVDDDGMIPGGIELPVVGHVDPVDAMLQYLYTSDYSDTTTSFGKAYEHPPVVLDALVHALADAVDIPPLVDLASANFCKRAVTDWNTPGFAQALRVIYEHAPEKARDMRRTVLAVVDRHAKELLSENYGAEFRAVIKDVKAFAEDVQVAAIARRQGLVKGKK